DARPDGPRTARWRVVGIETGPWGLGGLRICGPARPVAGGRAGRAPDRLDDAGPGRLRPRSRLRPGVASPAIDQPGHPLRLRGRSRSRSRTGRVPSTAGAGCWLRRVRGAECRADRPARGGADGAGYAAGTAGPALYEMRTPAR